jgi:hypothetical protein
MSKGSLPLILVYTYYPCSKQILRRYYKLSVGLVPWFSKEPKNMTYSKPSQELLVSPASITGVYAGPFSCS